ncbi:hypothetical protein RGQ29_020042 [Quercus rubra]|uniref:Reverse transcriptase zinc-binding domain-containing protein n=1 Tax=Quercus rubra TaxID=3512 RepID=A0AAN7FBW7_QUERU|nr:hypothetical protein RGQ29_020042 [Quercus rubra]
MEARVCVLIDAENGEWKVDLIREVFLEHEADSILSIPLGTILPANKLVWTAAANGKFSVKSAYNLARSDSSIMKCFWQKLWRAKVPNMVRGLGWKACQNILPTKMNLFHRQVTDDPIYEECGLEPETVLHVLCQCQKGKGDFTDVLCSNGMNQDQHSNLMHMILMIAWSLWRNRNERRFGGKNLVAAAIYGTAMTMLQEYYSAQEIVSQTRDVSPCRNKWTPPPHGWYKVNADGAVFSKQKWAGIGVIARDEQGRVVEAKALEAAAGFAKDIGVQKVIFDSDSLVVCSAIQGATEPPITIANIISIQHTRREGNRAAHGLVRHAQAVNDFVTWMEETPTIINSEVISDVHQFFQS